MISIAIDGPSGAGKSTIARAVAARLGFLYIDTGALYRAVGLYALRKGVDPSNAPDVTALLGQIQLELRHEEDGQHVLLCSEDVTGALRSPEVSMAASDVAANQAVREFLVELQRGIAREHNVIMDGRDIGTVILPGAQVKIFLTASIEDRARRRWQELRQKEPKLSYKKVLSQVRERDLQDSIRAAAPLRAAQDAITVDTTGNTLDESIRQLTMLIGNKVRQL